MTFILLAKASPWPFDFSPLPVEVASIFGHEEIAELLATHTPLELLVRTHNWCGQGAEALAEANGQWQLCPPTHFAFG